MKISDSYFKMYGGADWKRKAGKLLDKFLAEQEHFMNPYNKSFLNKFHYRLSIYEHWAIEVSIKIF